MQWVLIIMYHVNKYIFEKTFTFEPNLIKIELNKI